jgi:hypothetical protein
MGTAKDELDEKHAATTDAETSDEDRDEEERDDEADNDSTEGEDDDDVPSERGPKKTEAARPRAAAVPAQGGTSFSRNMILFVLALGAIGAAFAYLGQETQQGPAPAPKWQVNQTVDVELTLVASDSTDLACAASNEVAGKHCQFESQAKAWPSATADDKLVLKPYTTTNGIELAAAGLWSEAALTPAKLPKTRFSVKCKYKVEGKLTTPSVRWKSDGPWFTAKSDWYAGSVSGCTLE